MNTFEIGETFYIADPFVEKMYTMNKWQDSSMEIMINVRGLAFKTKEEAIAKSRAMIEYDKKQSYPKIMMVWNNANTYKQCCIVIGEIYGQYLAIDNGDVSANKKSLDSLPALIYDRSSFDVVIFENAKPATDLEQYLLDRRINSDEIDVIRQLALNEE